MEPSRDAREHDAARVIALASDDVREALTRDPSAEPTVPLVWPDHRQFAVDSGALRGTDPARALLLAEAHALGVLRRPSGRYLAAWRAKTVTLRGETDPVALDGLDSVTATEPSVGRRAALFTAADTAVNALRGDARALVDALRSVTATLGADTTVALGAGDAGVDAVLAATEEVFRELDPWACRALEIDRSRLTWADRLRSVAATGLRTQVPTATWAPVASRWMIRAGLESVVRRVTDDLRPAARWGGGVVALGPWAGERAVVAGRPTVAGAGALDVAGAVTEALAHAAGRGLTTGQRRGADAAVFGLARSLGRRLYLERHFVRREAGVDVAPRERVMLEALHAEVVQLRMDAARARFTALALGRAPDLAGCFVEVFTRAVGCAPSPVWAVHTAARALAPDGRYGAVVTGALAEPALADWLRARFDEDWFRNPHTGHGLVDVLQEARTAGVTAWRAGVVAEGTDPAKALARRFADALRDARRTTV